MLVQVFLSLHSWRYVEDLSRSALSGNSNNKLKFPKLSQQRWHPRAYSQYQQGHDFNNYLTYYIVEVVCCGILYPHTAFVCLTSLYVALLLIFQSPISDWPKFFPSIWNLPPMLRFLRFQVYRHAYLCLTKFFTLFHSSFLGIQCSRWPFSFYISMLSWSSLFVYFVFYVALMGYFWRLFLVKD